MTDLEIISFVAVIALVTAALRFLPFIVFRKSNRTPLIVEKLGRVLPLSIMGMLVVYCLKDVSFSAAKGFLPALISCAVVALLYIWKRNTLLSVICGTVCYMIMVQLIF
ncbi:MAG: AzlD domain-containing protein [Clostridia bacterium]|nr:AzlD domain-containing protein [Clostridia bacterium]